MREQGEGKGPTMPDKHHHHHNPTGHDHGHHFQPAADHDHPAHHHHGDDGSTLYHEHPADGPTDEQYDGSGDYHDHYFDRRVGGDDYYFGPADHNHDDGTDEWVNNLVGTHTFDGSDHPPTVVHVHDWQPYYDDPDSSLLVSADARCRGCGTYRLVTSTVYPS